MKKLILSTFILFAASFTLQAQILPTFKIGAKAGMNFTSLKSGDKILSSDTKAGYLAGLWGRVGIAGIHIQPEAYFTGKNTSIKTEGGDSKSIDLKAIDVPILLGTKVGLGPVGVRIQAGPLFSFMTNDIKAEGVDFKDKNSAIVGGLGADISKLSVDLRYEHGLSKFEKSSPNSKLNIWTISLGYSFL